jgi:hypothetical protein
LSCPALSHCLAPPSLVLSPGPPLTLPGSPHPASPWSSPPSSWSPCQLFSFPALPRPSLSFLPSPSLVPSPHPCLALRLTPAWPALPSPLPSPSLVHLAQPPRHLLPHSPWFISPRLTLVLLSLVLSPSLVSPAPPWSSCSAPPLHQTLRLALLVALPHPSLVASPHPPWSSCPAPPSPPSVISHHPPWSSPHLHWSSHRSSPLPGHLAPTWLSRLVSSSHLASTAMMKRTTIATTTNTKTMTVTVEKKKTTVIAIMTKTKATATKKTTTGRR